MVRVHIFFDFSLEANNILKTFSSLEKANIRFKKYLNSNNKEKVSAANYLVEHGILIKDASDNVTLSEVGKAVITELRYTYEGKKEKNEQV